MLLCPLQACETLQQHCMAEALFNYWPSKCCGRFAGRNISCQHDTTIAKIFEHASPWKDTLLLLHGEAGLLVAQEKLSLFGLTPA